MLHAPLVSGGEWRSVLASAWLRRIVFVCFLCSGILCYCTTVFLFYYSCCCLQPLALISSILQLSAAICCPVVEYRRLLMFADNYYVPCVSVFVVPHILNVGLLILFAISSSFRPLGDRRRQITHSLQTDQVIHSPQTDHHV